MSSTDLYAASMKVTLLAWLRETEGRLPDALRARVLARGAELVPELLAMVRNPDLSGECGGPFGRPRGGWALLNAVDLLCELKVADAVEPLLDILESTRFGGDVVHDWLLDWLPLIGEPVVEPAFARLAASVDEAAQQSLRWVLWDTKVQDERIWTLACRAFEENQEMGALAFQGHGDLRALPILEEAIRVIAAEGKERYPLADLHDAYDALGGSFPQDLADAVRVAYARRGWQWDPVTKAIRQ